MISLRPLSFIVFVVLLPGLLCLAFHFTSRFLASRHPRSYRVIALSQSEFVIQTRFFPCYWHFHSTASTLQEAFICISMLNKLPNSVLGHFYNLVNETKDKLNKVAENVLKCIKQQFENKG